VRVESLGGLEVEDLALVGEPRVLEVGVVDPAVRVQPAMLGPHVEAQTVRGDAELLGEELAEVPDLQRAACAWPGGGDQAERLGGGRGVAAQHAVPVEVVLHDRRRPVWRNVGVQRRAVFE